MMRKALLLAFFSFSLLGSLLFSTNAFAVEQVMPPRAPAAAKPAETKADAKGDLQSFLHDLFGMVYLIAPALAVIAIIFAGLRYVTSQGDPEAIKLAKEIIYGAISGLLLLLMARTLLNIISGDFPLDYWPKLPGSS